MNQQLLKRFLSISSGPIKKFKEYPTAICNGYILLMGMTKKEIEKIVDIEEDCNKYIWISQAYDTVLEQPQANDTKITALGHLVVYRLHTPYPPGLTIHVQKTYYDIFRKAYPECQFYIGNEDTAIGKNNIIAVKNGSEIIGYFMPIDKNARVKDSNRVK